VCSSELQENVQSVEGVVFWGWYGRIAGEKVSLCQSSSLHSLLFNLSLGRDFDFQGGDVSRTIPDASAVAQVVDCLVDPEEQH
jgi:hypothetical protein